MVAVAARADVAFWIHRRTADRAQRAPTHDERACPGHETGSLSPGEGEARRSGGGTYGVGLVLLAADELLDEDHDAVSCLVVGQPETSDDPFRHDRLRRWGAEVGLDGVLLLEEAGQVLGQRCHLRLLALERGDPAGFGGLQEEDAVAGLADGVGDDVVGLVKLERLLSTRIAHVDGPLPAPLREPRPPSLALTASTLGPPRV